MKEQLMVIREGIRGKIVHNAYTNYDDVRIVEGILMIDWKDVRRVSIPLARIVEIETTVVEE